MSRQLKRLTMLILSLALILLPSACGHNSPEPPAPEEPTEQFIGFLDDCFDAKDTIQVYDNYGANVTSDVLEDISDLYSDEDYKGIKAHLHDNEYNIAYINDFKRLSSSSAEVSCLACNVSTFPTGYMGEFMYHMVTTCKYDTENNEITEVTGPSVEMYYCSIPSGYAFSFGPRFHNYGDSVRLIVDFSVKDSRSSFTSGMEIYDSYRARYIITMDCLTQT